MVEAKEERKRNLCSALLAFNEDNGAGERLYRAYNDTGLFDSIGSAYLAGFRYDDNRVISNAKTINLAMEIDQRSLAVLASTENIDQVLDRCGVLAVRFRKELMLEVPTLPLSIIVRFSQRGMQPIIYQYKLLRNRDEEFDEISLGILASTGDSGKALSRFESVSRFAPNLPMQGQAILAAHTKDINKLQADYEAIERIKTEYEEVGNLPFDVMVGGILSLGDNPEHMLTRYRSYRSGPVWEGE